LEIIVISGANTNTRHCDHKTLHVDVHTVGYRFLTEPLIEWLMGHTLKTTNQSTTYQV